jgi:hypothetical protein
MPDSHTLAALLLVAGPILGALGLSSPSIVRVWTVPREEHLAIVGAHPRAWAFANAGFTVATLATAAGLIVVAGAVDVSDSSRAILVAAAVAYAIAGSLWCAVVAIRSRTTPTLAALVAARTPTEPAEALLGAAIGGLFVAFALSTGGALAAFGIGLLLGGVAAPVALFTIVVGAISIGWVLLRGDMIPAVLYVPTLAIGLAIVFGW